MFGYRTLGRQGSWLVALAHALQAWRGRWTTQPKASPRVPLDVLARNEIYFAELQCLRWHQ